MLVSHRDDLTVLGRDDKEVCEALDERGTLGPGGPGAILCQREDRDGLTCGGEHVDALVAVLKRQVDAGMPGNTAAPGEVQPDCPFRVTGAWRAVRAVRDAVRAAATVTPVVRQAMPLIIWRSLLRARTAILTVRLGLLPPAQLREVQRMELFKKALLDTLRPGLEPLGKIRFGCHYAPTGFPPRTRSVSSPTGP